MERVDCDLLLDVGANRGQFSLMARHVRPGLPICAYEPLTEEAEIFRRCLRGEAGVSLHCVALGETAGLAPMHISRRADSSSMLPIGRRQTEIFPDTEEVATRAVPVVPLDERAADWQAARRALLKIDVQGFELAVLRGARAALTHCQYVYVECSDVPLYVGQALFPEIADYLSTAGFRLLSRENESFANGVPVQADALFSRYG